MSNSNYPPGVTGFEPQIVGYDEEPEPSAAFVAWAEAHQDDPEGGEPCPDCGYVPAPPAAPDVEAHRLAVIREWRAARAVRAALDAAYESQSALPDDSLVMTWQEAEDEATQAGMLEGDEWDGIPAEPYDVCAALGSCEACDGRYGLCICTCHAPQGIADEQEGIACSACAAEYPDEVWAALYPDPMCRPDDDEMICADCAFSQE